MWCPVCKEDQPWSTVQRHTKSGHGLPDYVNASRAVEADHAGYGQEDRMNSMYVGEGSNVSSV